MPLLSIQKYDLGLDLPIHKGPEQISWSFRRLWNNIPKKTARAKNKTVSQCSSQMKPTQRPTSNLHYDCWISKKGFFFLPAEICGPVSSFNLHLPLWEEAGELHSDWNVPSSARVECGCSSTECFWKGDQISCRQGLWGCRSQNRIRSLVDFSHCTSWGSEWNTHECGCFQNKVFESTRQVNFKEPWPTPHPGSCNTLHQLSSTVII